MEVSEISFLSNDSESTARNPIISSTIQYISGKDNAESFDTSAFIEEWLLCRWCSNAVEDAAETGIPLSYVSPTTYARRQWRRENTNNSLKDWRKQQLNTAWKSAPTLAKLSSTASSQDYLPAYWWMKKAPEEMDQFKYLWSILANG